MSRADRSAWSTNEKSGAWHLTNDEWVDEDGAILVKEIAEPFHTRSPAEVSAPDGRVHEHRLHARRRRTGLSCGPSPNSALRRFRASRSSRARKPISMTSVFDLAPVSWSARRTRSASRSSVVLMHIIMHDFYASGDPKIPAMGSAPARAWPS